MIVHTVTFVVVWAKHLLECFCSSVAILLLVKNRWRLVGGECLRLTKKV